MMPLNEWELLKKELKKEDAFWYNQLQGQINELEKKFELHDKLLGNYKDNIGSNKGGIDGLKGQLDFWKNQLKIVKKECFDNTNAEIDKYAGEIRNIKQDTHELKERYESNREKNHIEIAELRERLILGLDTRLTQVEEGFNAKLLDINELKEQVKRLNKYIHRQIPDDYAHTRIDELKEHINSLHIDTLQNKVVLRELGKEFINLIDDKIAHGTARLHETSAKDNVEKQLKKLDGSDWIKEQADGKQQQKEWRIRECNHKFTSQFPFWECGICGYHEEYIIKKDGDSLKKALEFTEKVMKEKDGSEYLNPHLKCNGECYECEDNIPSHGSVPNLCGRQDDGEIDSNRNKDNCNFYNKDNCNIPCSWWKCNIVEMGRKGFFNLLKDGSDPWKCPKCNAELGFIESNGKLTEVCDCGYKINWSEEFTPEDIKEAIKLMENDVGKQKEETPSKLKEFIEFTKIRFEDLKKTQEICKKEDCLKIEEMLCHILYYKSKEETPSKYRCLDCNRIWNSLQLDQNEEGDLMCPVCDCTGFDIEKEPTPSKCEFCGRELIFYNEKWICGHGCIKPAIKPKEPTELTETAKIIQIIEKYDNGHHNVFDPEDHILVKREALKRWYDLIKELRDILLQKIPFTSDDTEDAKTIMKEIKTILGEEK